MEEDIPTNRTSRITERDELLGKWIYGHPSQRPKIIELLKQLNQATN